MAALVANKYGYDHFTTKHYFFERKGIGGKVKVIELPRPDIDFVGLILDIGFGVRHPETDIKKMCQKKFVADAEITKKYREVLSVPDSTYYEWTKDIRKAMQEQIHENMITAYLDATRTQESVAKDEGQGYDQSKVSRLIDGICKILNMSFLHMPIKETIKEDGIEKDKQFVTLDDYLKEKEMSFLKPALTFSPQLYNIWNMAKMDHDTAHFGAFPMAFMLNLLYYHTKIPHIKVLS